MRDVLLANEGHARAPVYLIPRWRSAMAQRHGCAWQVVPIHRFNDVLAALLAFGVVGHRAGKLFPRLVGVELKPRGLELLHKLQFPPVRCIQLRVNHAVKIGRQLNFAFPD